MKINRPAEDALTAWQKAGASTNRTCTCSICHGFCGCSAHTSSLPFERVQSQIAPSPALYQPSRSITKRATPIVRPPLTIGRSYTPLKAGFRSRAAHPQRYWAGPIKSFCSAYRGVASGPWPRYCFFFSVSILLKFELKFNSNQNRNLKKFEIQTKF
jgi:hypothetical protein